MPEEAPMFVTGLTRIMQAAGVEYEVVQGWEKRSLWRAGLSNTIRACMWHDTQSADASFASGRDAPTLQYCVNGLGYPLYNVLFGRSGKAYIIAAGSAAHAGRGSGGGMTRDDANREAIAFSFDANQSKYPVTAEQLESAARVGKAMTDDWGGNLVHMMHGEWNPRERHDPTRIPGGWVALKAAIKRGWWSTRPAAAKPAATRPAAPKTSTVQPLTPDEGELSMSDIKQILEAINKAAEDIRSVPQRTWQYKDHQNAGHDYDVSKSRQLGLAAERAMSANSRANRAAQDAAAGRAMLDALAEHQDDTKEALIAAVRQAAIDGAASATAADVAEQLEVSVKKED